MLLATGTGHDVTVLPSDVLPRGWSEAFIWACACGTESDSIMRTARDAVEDHRIEHIGKAG